MKRITYFALTASVLLGPALLAQAPQQSGGLDPAAIKKPLGDDWPTYSGDYSGRRFSSLTQINQSNVKNLSLAWVSKLTSGLPPAAGGRGGFPGGGRGGGGGARRDRRRRGRLAGQRTVSAALSVVVFGRIFATSSMFFVSW